MAEEVSERGTTAESLTDSVMEDDLTTCSVCGAKLGKRYMNPRHHCRMCGRCVCSQCSPSALQLDGSAKPQRVCTPCVAAVPKAAQMKTRVAELGERLHELAAGQAGSARSSAEPAASLEEAVLICEAALGPLEEARQRADVAPPSSLQRRVNELAHGMRQLGAGTGPAFPGLHASRTEDLSLDEALKLCEDSLASTAGQDGKKAGQDSLAKSATFGALSTGENNDLREELEEELSQKLSDQKERLAAEAEAAIRKVREDMRQEMEELEMGWQAEAEALKKTIVELKAGEQQKEQRFAEMAEEHRLARDELETAMLKAVEERDDLRKTMEQEMLSRLQAEGNRAGADAKAKRLSVSAETQVFRDACVRLSERLQSLGPDAQASPSLGSAEEAISSCERALGPLEAQVMRLRDLQARAERAESDAAREQTRRQELEAEMASPRRGRSQSNASAKSSQEFQARAEAAEAQLELEQAKRAETEGKLAFWIAQVQC